MQTIDTFYALSVNHLVSINKYPAYYERRVDSRYFFLDRFIFRSDSSSGKIETSVLYDGMLGEKATFVEKITEEWFERLSISALQLCCALQKGLGS